MLLKASLRVHSLAVVHDNGAVQLLRHNGGQPCRAYKGVPVPQIAAPGVCTGLQFKPAPAASLPCFVESWRASLPAGLYPVCSS